MLLGRYADAEPLIQRSVVIWEKSLGPDHPNVAAALNNLAGVDREQGKHADAEALYKPSLAISEKAIGPDHPDVAQFLNNLAGVYREQGKYADAESLRGVIATSAISHGVDVDEFNMMFFAGQPPDIAEYIHPPFDPQSVVEEYAELLKAYRIRSITGDNYSAEWAAAAFAKAGIGYHRSEKNKSELYWRRCRSSRGVRSAFPITRSSSRSFVNSNGAHPASVRTSLIMDEMVQTTTATRSPACSTPASKARCGTPGHGLTVRRTIPTTRRKRAASGDARLQGYLNSYGLLP